MHRIFVAAALLSSVLLASPSVGQEKGGVLRIISSDYATANAHCDATSFVRTLCEGQKSCTFQANNNMCGDTDPGHIKTLTTSYACGEDTAQDRTTSGNEVSLKCPIR